MKPLYFSIYYSEDLYQELLIKCIKPLIYNLKENEVKFSFYYSSHFQGSNIIVVFFLSEGLEKNKISEVRNRVVDEVELFFKGRPSDEALRLNPNDLGRVFQNQTKNTIKCIDDSFEEENLLSQVEENKLFIEIADQATQISFDYLANSPQSLESSIVFSVRTYLDFGYISGCNEMSEFLTFLSKLDDYYSALHNHESVSWVEKNAKEFYQYQKGILTSVVKERLGYLYNEKHSKADKLRHWGDVSKKFQTELVDIRDCSPIILLINDQIRLDNQKSYVVLRLLMMLFTDLQNDPNTAH